MHLSWDIMVGLGTLLTLLALWYAASWLFKRDYPEEQVVPPGSLVRRRPRPSSRIEAGWVVTEVGRQPWIVYNYLKVEDAATTNGGVWITFLVVAALYLGARGHHDPRAARA